MASQGGSEVSKKIRAAIKAKLVELGAYVDEELPDYIMVMIANKKTKEQMKSDLQLFLGKNAFKFVDWLFDIFDRLQAVGKPQKESKDERTKTASKDRKEKDDRPEKSDKKDKRTKEKEKERVKARETSSHKSLKEKPKSSKTAEVASSSERKVASAERSKEHRSKEARPAIAAVEETGEIDLEMHVEPIGDAIDAEMSEAEAKAKEQRLKDERHQHHQRPKEHRRTSRSPTHHGKRTVGRVQPMRHEPVPQEEKPRALRSTIAPVSSVVRIAAQQISARSELRRPPTADMAPRPSLFLKAMHDASVSAALRPTIAQKEKKPPTRKRQKSESSESDASPHRSRVHQKKTRKQEKEQPKMTTSDEKRRHHREHSSTSKRKVELKYEEDDDTEILMVDESVKTIETKTRFVITMSGLSDSFHNKFHNEAANDEEEIENIDELEEKPSPAKIIPKPKAEPSIPLKPTISKQLPEQKSTRPVKLKLTHRQEEQEVERVDEDEEPEEDEPMVADSYRQERNGSADISNGESTTSMEAADTRNVIKTSESGQTPVWRGHFNPVSITLDDDDEEEEIDAMMASDASGSFVSGSFDATELPPTETMSRPSPVPAPTADKIMERCKFWPACRQGDSCTYVHPTKHCLTFPKCTFGEKCLYIHPNCKFDQSCTRPNCPYTHAGKKAAGITVMPPARPKYVTKIVQQDFSTVPIPCKYAAKCTNIRCPFKHPKPCRFAAECLNPTCPFAHPKKREDPSINAVSAKYKWKADNPVSAEQEPINSVSSIAA